MLLLQAHTLAEHAPSVGLLESKNVLFCEYVSPHPAVTAKREKQSKCRLNDLEAKSVAGRIRLLLHV